MAFEPSQGITFIFSGATFTANQIGISNRVNEIDVTSLSSTNGSFRSLRPAPVRDAPEIKVDFVGLSKPQMTATGQITWVIDGSGTNAGFTTDAAGVGLPTAAMCTSADITAQVGELIKGSATFRLTKD